jgi:hypothetical protein
VTHEIRRRRLDALEKASGFSQRASGETIRIVFDEEATTHCEGPGFRIDRRDAESFHDFEWRMHSEALARRPARSPLPPPVLIFHIPPELAANSSMKSTP